LKNVPIEVEQCMRSDCIECYFNNPSINERCLYCNKKCRHYYWILYNSVISRNARDDDDDDRRNKKDSKCNQAINVKFEKQSAHCHCGSQNHTHIHSTMSQVYFIFLFFYFSIHLWSIYVQ